MTSALYVPAASIAAVLGGVALWVIFAVLLILALTIRLETWLKPIFAFAMTTTLPAAVVVTLVAAGVKIGDYVAVLNQLGIKAP